MEVDLDADHTIDDDYRVLFEDMYDAWFTAPAPAPVPIGEGTRRDAADIGAVRVAHGWMTLILRTGRAALLLDREGFSHETSPLLRSMIEHAIALRWLEDMRGDAFQVLVRMRRADMAKLRKAQETGWVMGDDETQALLTAAIETETDPHIQSLDYLQHTRHRADKYELGLLYQMWLIHSGGSHPSHSSSRPYWTESDDLGSELLHKPLGPTFHVGGTVVPISHFALGVYQRFLPERTFEEKSAEWLARGADLKTRLEARLATKPDD